MQMRQATSEASIDDDARQKLLEVLDQLRAGLLAKVAVLSHDPRSVEERIAALQPVMNDLNSKLTNVARPYNDAIRPHLTRVMVETKALAEDKAPVLAAYQTLDLTEEQRGKIESEIERLGSELQDAKKEGDLPESERRVIALLRARTEIRKHLTDEQVAKRDKWVDERNAAEQPKPRITGGPLRPLPQPGKAQER